MRTLKAVLTMLCFILIHGVSHAETPAGNQEGHSVLAGVNTNFLSARFNIPRANANEQEIDCLARNMYYEARGESTEGRVAVGVVTINRRNDSRFPNTICGVVNQRARSVCQFSWRCNSVRAPNRADSVWLECQRLARTLLTDRGYFQQFRQRMGNILYFHASYVRPSWSRSKVQLIRIGSHLFYGDR